MKVAHFVTIAPNRCGLYGTARDLLKAEQGVGIDAGFVDCSISNNEAVVNGFIEGYPKIKDDEIIPKSVGWARRADVYIRHSLIPVELQNSGKPLVMAVHGRPESSFRLEASGQIPVISMLYKRARDKRYAAFLCFWKEYIFQLSTIIPRDKLFYIPAPVDLEHFSPGKPKYDLGENAGSPNLLICDIWREDVIPFNVIFAALLFQQKYCKTAKIHVVALNQKDLEIMSGFFRGIKELGALGILSKMNTRIRDFYMSADIVITPHTIATRTVREPLACGIPVVAGTGNRFTPYTANPNDIEGFAKTINSCWQDYKSSPSEVKRMARQVAEMSFNIETTGEAMKVVLEKIA